ncbi:MAG: DUF4013 domain-containing protein [Halococcoides sp.]
MVELEETFRWPFEDENWPITIGIGGILSMTNTIMVTIALITLIGLGLVLIGFLIAPVFVLLAIAVAVPMSGYAIGVMRATIEGADPPRFEDWRRLLRDGIVVFAIRLAYFVPVLVVGLLAGVLALIVAGVVVLVDAEAVTAIGTIGVVAVGSIIVGVVSLYSLCVGYLIPISDAIYAHEGDLRTALSPDRIKPVALSSEFAIYWLIAIVIQLIAGQILGLLYLVLVGFFVQFYLYIVMARLFAKGYAGAMEIETAPA